jgi:hypothetical protein
MRARPPVPVPLLGARHTRAGTCPPSPSPSPSPSLVPSPAPALALAPTHAPGVRHCSHAHARFLLFACPTLAFCHRVNQSGILRIVHSARNRT